MSGAGSLVALELSAVILALDAGEVEMQPVVLTPEGPAGRDLPTAAFDPGRHRTLQTALRAWVAEQTGLELGYVEQLYSFGDPVRSLGRAPGQPHTVSIGYLALVGPEAAEGPDWTRWTRWFPWEDRRACEAQDRLAAIRRALAAWARRPDQVERVALLFGDEDHPWREELVLERYELLYEADLVAEAWRDRGAAVPADLPGLGSPAPRDHRRILATGIGRLRAKLKYRPVLFELVGPAFTLLELQRATEAVAGLGLHKQNFRRMLARSGLIEPTGAVSTRHGGRPAAEYRLASEALSERRAAAVRFGAARRGG